MILGCVIADLTNVNEETALLFNSIYRIHKETEL